MENDNRVNISKEKNTVNLLKEGDDTSNYTSEMYEMHQNSQYDQQNNQYDGQNQQYGSQNTQYDGQNQQYSYKPVYDPAYEENNIGIGYWFLMHTLYYLGIVGVIVNIIIVLTGDLITKRSFSKGFIVAYLVRIVIVFFISMFCSVFGAWHNAVLNFM